MRHEPRCKVTRSIPTDVIRDRGSPKRVIGRIGAATVGILVAGTLALLNGSSAALADEIQIVRLRYRTVDQVLPILRQLVEPGGAVTGMEGQIIMRASPHGLRQLEAALASIDQPTRRLMISVSQDRVMSSERREIEAGGTIGRDRAAIDVRANEARRDADARVSQRVQALDGSPAYISIGQSTPMRTQTMTRTPSGTIISQSTVMRDTSTGFAVLPRVVGDRVTLEINPRVETPNDPDRPFRGANVQSVETVVTGRLGEWIELALIANDTAQSDRGILSGSTATRQDRRSVWVKVDEIQ